MAARRWKDLSPTTRRVLIVAGVIESILKALALWDLKRRPASQIRGPKWAWAPAITIVNSFGAVPLAYFAFGRRKQPGSPVA